MQVDHKSTAGTITAAECAVVGVLHVKHDGTIVGANQAALSLLNYPLDFHLTGKLFVDLSESVDAVGWAEILNVLQDVSAAQFRAVFRSHSGGYVASSCLAVCELGATVVDIFLLGETDSSEYVDEILKRLESFESFFDTRLIDINVKDTDGRYVATSKMFDETFNLPRGHAIGKRAHDIYPKEFSDHVSSHDEAVLSEKKVITQIDVVPFTGKHLLVQKFPLYKEDSVSGIGVFAVDVTALQTREQRHIEAKNKYADFVDLCQDTVWETDRTWVVRDTNKSGALNVTGIRFEIGKNLLQELQKHVADRHKLRTFVNTLERDQTSFSVFELNNGRRIRLGIKPVETRHENETDLVYRGIVIIIS